MPSSARVPVIDIAHLENDPDAKAALADACRNWGFFQITGHGFPENLISNTLAQSHAFFDLPLERKRAIERTAENAWGYYDKELTKNRRDLKQTFDYGPDGDSAATGAQRAQWPADLPGFRPVIEAYYAACESVSFRLLGAIVCSLGMPATHLHGGFTPRHTSFLRLNYYPATDADGDSFGVHHHTDSGALTVLMQDDHAGLQVLHDGEWILIEPRADALVINIGDIVQVWSNDLYPAALHRVLASRGAARHSAPFFFNPAYDFEYAPLETVSGESRPPRYRPINWGEFRAQRSAGDYADHGEEIQISHYRIEGAAAQGSAIE